MFGLNVNSPIRELVYFLKNRNNNNIQYKKCYVGLDSIYRYGIYESDITLIVEKVRSWDRTYFKVKLTSKSGHKVHLTKDEVKLLSKTVIRLYNSEKDREKRNEDISGRNEIKSVIEEK